MAFEQRGSGRASEGAARPEGPPSEEEPPLGLQPTPLLPHLIPERPQAGFWDWDLPRGKVYGSPRLREILGWVAAAGLPPPPDWANRMHLEDAPIFEASLQAHLRGDTPSHALRFRLWDGSGAWRHLESRGQVVARDEEERPLRMAGFVLDRTAPGDGPEVPLEVRSLQGLGFLAAGVAHDFNNLLQVVMGHAALAQEEVRIGGRAEAHFRHLHSAVEHAREIARQLLEAAGTGGVALKLLDLAELAGEMGSLLQAILPKGVRLEVDGTGPLPVLGNPGALKQVVLNLVTNATEALGRTGGSITLRARPLEGFGRVALLEVTDTGCGMDEATQRRAFEPFFSTKGRGRGLGLATLRGILHDHGGSLELESRLGQGSAFRLRLPLVEPYQQVPKNGGPKAAVSGKR